MEGELTPCERGKHTWRACITNDGGKHKWLECRRCNKVKGKRLPENEGLDVNTLSDLKYLEWQRMQRELAARSDQLIFTKEHVPASARIVSQPRGHFLRFFIKVLGPESN